MLEIHNFTQNEIDKKFFQKITEEALRVAGIKDETEISLAIVGDGRIRKLNKIYRGKNKVTDVLSFSDKTIMPYLFKAFVKIKKSEEFIKVPDGINRLGEIVICYPRAKKQAKALNHSLEKELTILLVHGILQLLGYDHEKGEAEAEKMKNMEEKILCQKKLLLQG